MRPLAARLPALYGAGPVHLLLMVGSLALALYAVVELGLDGLWDPDSWWQSISVWFVGAALAHDLIVFPIYALVDRLVTASVRSTRSAVRPARVNHIRVPLMASALTLFVFLPGIVQQGSDAHLRATGLTQDPYLERWLVLTLAFTALSALVYLFRRALTHAKKSSSSGVGDRVAPSADPGEA